MPLKIEPVYKEDSRHRMSLQLNVLIKDARAVIELSTYKLFGFICLYVHMT